MSAAGAWTLALAGAYTALLVLANRSAHRSARRRAAGAAPGGDSFFVGDRAFSPWTVAFCITGLFTGSSYISILELSYSTGVSALWYGVAETVQILLIALLLVRPLRRRLVVTVSGIVGDRFGRAARAATGLVTALTFPMWSVATTIAFASALAALTHLSLELSVAATALLLLAFLVTGGMRSVGLNQTLNCAAFALMAVTGVIALCSPAGRQALADLPAHAELLQPFGAGTPLILAWFGTFLVNVPLAQAAFQMSLSARTPRDGRTGLLRAAALGLPLILLGVALGTTAAIAIPAGQPGLVALPRFLASALPAPLVGVFFLGVWACALGWAGPCQFSGATSLGRDVGRALRPGAPDARLVRWTRWSLVLLTVVMILLALLRTEQAAWWNVLAWTLRNGATLGPVLAAFFWPLATRRAALTAVLAGFASGLAWYAASGFDVTGFTLGIHPVWIGMSANLAALVATTLLQRRPSLRAGDGRRAAALGAAGALAAALAIASILWAPMAAIPRLGLLGPLILAAVLLGSAAAVIGSVPVRHRAAEGAPERFLPRESPACERTG